MSVFRIGTNKSSVNNFPSIRPTLDLNFANTKTLDPRITFTRASGGSYVGADGLIKYAGVNEARFDHDPETGESLGLLIEESRSNLLSWSENFNNWGIYSGVNPATITRKESNIKSPDGISNYFVCTYGATDLRQSFLGGGGKTYTASCFYKQPSNGDISDLAAFEIHIIGGSTSIGQITYSFSQNKIIRSTGNVPVTTGFQKYSDNSVRLWITITDDGDGTGVFFLNLRGGNTPSNVGKSILTWGAQIEEGSFPTSYIPTQASTRTRAADFAYIKNIDKTDWFNKDEGTLIFQHTKIPVSANQPLKYPAFGFARTQNGNSTNTIQYFLTRVGEGFYLVRNINNIFELSIGVSQTESTVGFNYKTNEFSISRNGLLMRQIFSGVLPLNFYMLVIGFNSINSNEQINAHCKYLRYYPKSLPNLQLQQLTR